MWAARLLFTPAGKAFILLAALLAWTSFQRHDAARDERTRVTLAYEQAKIAEIARQKAIGDAAIAAARRRAEAAEAQIAKFQETADALSSELEAAGNSCPLDDSVRKRLLSIK